MIDQAWIEAVKARGLAQPLSTMLDVLEPLGPIGAQLLWVAQPLSALWGASAAVGNLAETLEQPEGIEHLRRLLNEDGGGNGG